MKFAVVGIVLASFLLSAALYSRLPERMPTHWDLAGRVDHYASRPVGAFLFPTMMIAIALIFAALPRISPRGYDLDARSRAFRAIFLATLILLLALQIFVLLSSIGVRSSVMTVVPLLVGALLVVVGNYLSKVPRNFFIGIRTPWTLADEDVWFRTHRFGSRLFVLGGLAVMAVGPFLREESAGMFVLAVIGTVALVSVVYSFLIYRRLNAATDKGDVSP